MFLENSREDGRIVDYKPALRSAPVRVRCTQHATGDTLGRWSGSACCVLRAACCAPSIPRPLRLSFGMQPPRGVFHCTNPPFAVQIQPLNALFSRGAALFVF